MFECGEGSAEEVVKGWQRVRVDNQTGDLGAQLEEDGRGGSHRVREEKEIREGKKTKGRRWGLGRRGRAGTSLRLVLRREKGKDRVSLNLPSSSPQCPHSVSLYVLYLFLTIPCTCS